MSSTSRSVLVATLFLGLPSGAAAQQATTVRVSVSSSGAQGNAPAFDPTISVDGRFVAFYSGASTLVSGDTNVALDVFVRDVVAGTTVRASVDSAGSQADDRSRFAALSADGRYVVFESRATNLVPGDANGIDDVFVRDLAAGTTEIASIATGGTQGDLGSFEPAISGDGRYVAFQSAATNLVPGDTNGEPDIFVHDRVTGSTERVSVATGGGQVSGASIQAHLSGDGRYVVFTSFASDVVPGDANGFEDVFVRDRIAGTTELVSLAAGGSQGNDFSANGSISSDGRYVAFESRAALVPGDGLPVDVYVRDRQAGTTEKVSVATDGTPGNATSLAAAISADGRYVAFQSDASNFVSGDTNLEDIFLRDRLVGRTERVSVTAAGSQASNDCEDPAVSADGRFVVFSGLASNLVAGDTNGTWDVFARDRGVAIVYCTAKVNSLGCTPAIGSSGTPSASAGSGFLVTAANELNRKLGLLLYSTAGPAAVPFQGGTLCLQAPLRRTPAQNTGGSPLPAQDCSGALALDFNARIASGVDPALVAGATVWCQYYSRDPGFAPPNNTSLTAGLEFTIAP